MGGHSDEGACDPMIPCPAETIHSPELFLQDHHQEMPFSKVLTLPEDGAGIWESEVTSSVNPIWEGTAVWSWYPARAGD